MKEFEGKVVIVTGASSGIGRATALAFARGGASVVVAARREDEGRQTLALIEKQGGQGLFVRADVAREVDVRQLVERTLAAYSRLDYAFNNAGIEGELGPVTAQTEQNFDAVFDVNVKGVLFCMKHEIPAMLTTGGGVIVNCASVGGFVGFPNASVYSASKHAVMGLTRSVALETAGSGVRINVVAPTATRTSMFDRFTGHDAGTQKAIAQSIPMGRVGEVEEMAGAVLFLCSSRATFMTGQSVTVDGGLTAQ
jgi:NAD(P)-dependent dehydrogenase (short-subunit alcohol dehydrogenase family)